MSRPIIHRDNGDHEVNEPRVGSPKGAAPVAERIELAPHEESLAAAARKAYGHNSAALRERLRQANTDMKGTINAPRQ